MIVDRLCNAAAYYGISSAIEKALKYLQSTDFTDIKPGTYYIDDNNMYVIISEYNTKPSEEAKFEAHNKYIDVQYIIEGTEKMGYTNVENIKVTINYDEKKDILFGEGIGDFITMPAGSFAIFMPQDAHMPNIKIRDSAYVKKAVVKIMAK